MSEPLRHVSRAELAAMGDEETIQLARRGELRHLLDPKSVTREAFDEWSERDQASAIAENRAAHLGLEPTDQPAAVDRDAPIATGSADQGGRGTPALGPVRREDLAAMSLSEYEAAKRAGRLDALLRGET